MWKQEPTENDNYYLVFDSLMLQSDNQHSSTTEIITIATCGQQNYYTNIW